jgi:hypothetical protein
MNGTVEWNSVDAILPLLDELERVLARLRDVAERMKDEGADDD